jgi:flagellar M-ring protein FliF
MPPTLSGIGQLWSGLPRIGRLLLVLGLAATAGLAAAFWAADTVLADYQILFSNLSAEDAGAVIEALKAAKVPYRVGEGQVQVPAGRVHEWRMRLASQGMPSGGGVGFEIFDKNQFGLTDFSQRLNYQRALQGELARTIGQLREVQQARVHLAMPAPRVFSAQEKAPSASVVLRLRPGAVLRPEQVRGIVHLVTAAVEGLAPERVTVVDTAGRMLASGQDRGSGVSGNQGEARTGIEQEIERRVQGLLDPIVGPGRSAVRVSALVNFDQVERTEERFDPKPQVRAQQKSTETSQGASTQPTAIGAGDKTQVREGSSTNRTQRENEQTTFEIARTVEKTVVAPGNVKRMSVAVLLDVPVVDGKRVPRPDEELERIKKLVASGAGVRADRQDELEVLQVPFDPGLGAPGESAAAGAPAPEKAAARSPYLLWGVGGGAALLVMGAVFMLSRGRRRRAALEDAVLAVAAASGPNGIAADAATLLSGGAPGVTPLDITKKQLSPEEELRDRVVGAAREHPEEMAQIIRAWMVKKRAASA